MSLFTTLTNPNKSYYFAQLSFYFNSEFLPLFTKFQVVWRYSKVWFCFRFLDKPFESALLFVACTSVVILENIHNSLLFLTITCSCLV